MDGDHHVGSGTAFIALGLLVDRHLVAPTGVLERDHLHVVLHSRGRHDRAHGSAGCHQHCASAQPAARTLPRAAQAVSQHGGQARPAHGFVGARGVAAVSEPRACQQAACPGRGRRQAVSLLVDAAQSVFAVPLAARIHEGLVWSNRDQRTLLDKMLGLLKTVDIKASYYFVADAYYAAGKVVKGLLAQGHHLLSRVKSNAVAYQPAEPPKGNRKRGAPKRYGKKIKVKSLLSDPNSMQQARSPVYGEHKVMLRYRVCDLLWRPAGQLVRFVAVIHPTRGPLLLMCTDLSLEAIDIIRLYG